MNDKSKKKRQERVRKQRLLQKEEGVRQKKKKKEEVMADRKERRYFNGVQHQRLEYMKDLNGPGIKEGDSTLERNIKVLEAAIAEHEALAKYREGHKEEADKLFEGAKKQQAEYAQGFRKQGANEVD